MSEIDKEAKTKARSSKPNINLNSVPEGSKISNYPSYILEGQEIQAEAGLEVRVKEEAKAGMELIEFRPRKGSTFQPGIPFYVTDSNKDK